MKRLFAFLFALCFLYAPRADAAVPAFAFATIDQAKAVLTARDEFVQRLSPFDRAARLKTNADVSEAQYLIFVGTQAAAWSEADKAQVQAVLADLTPRLAAMPLPWPATVLLIKTTGQEEGGAPYTRANAIILPATVLSRAPRGELQEMVAHELFHILTRQSPALKEKLYAAIGFKPCGEVAFPVVLRSRKITSPDAPKNDHCIRLDFAGEEAWAIPLLFATSERYDPARGGEFFAYLELSFLKVEGGGAEPPAKATYDNAQLYLVPVTAIRGFTEQVGRNTEYIIHPEEILADNFSLLLAQDKAVASPDVLQKIRAILLAAKPS